MNFKKVSDSDLIRSTKNLVKKELQLGAEILTYLQEIQDRKLYASWGYSSLFEFCTKELGYGESVAYQKISAVRIVKEIPEVKEKLKAGELTMATVTQAQSFFRKEAKHGKKTYTTEQKKEVLKQLESKSKRQAEKILVELSPEGSRPYDKERLITTNQTEVRFVASDELKKKLDRIRSLKSHSLPRGDYDELFTKMADLVLSQIDPVEKAKRKQKQRTANGTKSPTHPYNKRCDMKASTQRHRKVNGQPTMQPPRTVSVPLRQEVWISSGGRCSFKDPGTGNRCDSRKYLQVDHMQPVALGGKSDRQNLRILCQQHNLLMARRSFGKAKMSKYVE